MNASFLGLTVRDASLWAGVGYVIGHLAEKSAEKMAAVFAISMVANQVFLLLNDYLITDKTSPKGKKNYHNEKHISSFTIGCVTAVALQRMQLLNGTWASYLALGSFLFHASQIKLS